MATHIFNEDERPPFAARAISRWAFETGHDADSSDPRHAVNGSHCTLGANLVLPIVVTCSSHRFLR
jgi:hypothetical protein